MVLGALLAGCGGRDGDGDARRATVETTAPLASTAPAGSVSPVDRLGGIGDAQQVVTVVADADGDTTATFTAYERVGGAWVLRFGPWTADIGAAGFAAPGAKREGDNRTPSGAYGFDFAFGVRADPGVRLAYRRVTSDAVVWDDDPASPRYNQWVDTAVESAGADPEPMLNPPAYDYGAVIAYNVDRTPGLGSAIFLHVSKAGPTAGCVALPEDRLLEVLRWLDPAKTPRIVMGTRAGLEP
ncbi:MAG: L,D-transpeptidase [Actinomycetota bacterium]